MGKASKRRTTRPDRSTGTLLAEPAPFVARPFAELPDETEWVALREILPAATASVRLAEPRGGIETATVTTVLPLAWPALHRQGHDVFVATQSGATSGDASRDLAAALLLACDAAEGTPVTVVPTPTASSPRLQDLLDTRSPFEVVLHDGFDFWVADTHLDDEGQASLQRANESVIPTARVKGVTSAYWCLIGERAYLRWVLPHDEDLATNALARLHAAGRSRLTPDARLLGAFRASGLLVPVWEVPRDVVVDDLVAPVAAMGEAIEEAAASSAPLDADERRARAGLQSRQVTLR
ncbi:DUF5926 family protein [Lapillicoccus sp.]|uniref:DUF5926 family protein n=1 Tax=Lapillicoccus sp. TaxID=1909287 RepID=UPI00326559AC